MRAAAVLAVAIVAIAFTACRDAVPPSAISSTPAAIDVHDEDRARIDAAIQLSGEKLRALVQPDGSFLYEYRADTLKPIAGYNIVRHAGAIYALAQLEQMTPDPHTRDALLRATRYLLATVKPIGQAQGSGSDAGAGSGSGAMSTPVDIRAIHSMSTPGMVEDSAVLGGTGLGVVALVFVEQIQRGTVPADELRALGRFLLLMQRADGSFSSTYTHEDGATERFDSLYYPGEAIYALELLASWETANGGAPDDAARWHDAALRGLRFLATSRANLTGAKIPADNWALIATEQILRRGDIAPADREQLVGHARQIAAANISTQITDPHDKLYGCYTPDGRTTPSATRLEGLIAATAVLPPDQLGASIDAGVRFVIASQLPDGAIAADQRGRTVRIDYIQHALSALIRYRARSSAWKRAPS